MTLTVEDGAGYRVSGDAQSAEVVVEDNDEAEFALSLDPAELAEGESATIQVTVTNGVTFEDGQTIALDFAGSTATKGTDYTVSRLRNSWGWRLGAVLNSPGKHPFALDRRLDAGSGGPAARREVEVGLFRRVADRASEHRWVTDAGRAPRGVAGGALVMSPGVRAGRR